MFDDLRESATPLIAAIDMGSNSFRLEVGHIGQDGYQRRHCSKEMVSLGTDLDAQGRLSSEASERGMRCLRKFSAELARLSPSRVRVVATQTLREAHNRDEFLQRAEAMLGLPVEVISGQEEARLIYVGVSFLHPSLRRRLVIDIGGRSTELIVGQGRKLVAAESFRLGSASLSQQFFADGLMSAVRFNDAQQAVFDQMGEPLLSSFGPAHWDEVMGASGTAGTISALLKANGITDGALTPKGLRWLIARCIAAGNVECLDLPGLKPHRRSLLPGGLSILYALTQHCGIRRLQSARGALRQGVIVDLHENQQVEQADTSEMGREVQMIRSLQQRFGVDPAQAQRVTETALNLLRQLQPQADAKAQRELGWAAALHELGMQISVQGHHRHGCYVLRNAGAGGFSAQQLRRVGALILGQRGGLYKLAPGLRDMAFAAQLLCLRLAVIYCRPGSRLESMSQVPLLNIRGREVKLRLPNDWTKAHAASLRLLIDEADRWSSAGPLELVLAQA